MRHIDVYLARCPACGATGFFDERQKGFGLSEAGPVPHAQDCPDSRSHVWATARARGWDGRWQVDPCNSDAGLYPRHDGAGYGPIAVGLTREQAIQVMREILAFTLDADAVAKARAERDARWAAQPKGESYVQYCAPDDAIKISGAWGW